MHPNHMSLFLFCAFVLLSWQRQDLSHDELVHTHTHTHTLKEGSGEHCETRQQGTDAAGSNYFSHPNAASHPALAGYSQSTAIQNSCETNRKRLNRWQIFKEHAVKVTPMKNITFLAFRFKRSSLLYIRYQPPKMTVASVSVVDFVTGGSPARRS